MTFISKLTMNCSPFSEQRLLAIVLLLLCVAGVRKGENGGKPAHEAREDRALFSRAHFDTFPPLLVSVVASWLARSTPERAARARAQAGDIVLCSWARHFTLTVPLSTEEFKWVPANLMLGVTLPWTSIPSRGE